MSDGYRDPGAYWERRLRKQFDLRGVGYAMLGERYNAELYRVRRARLERALARAGVTLEAKDVLEIGCGTGFYTRYCAERGVASYVGVDLTAVSVASLKQQFIEWQFVEADVGDSSFAVDGSFDVVLIADVLFHIVESARFQTALANVASRLRSGGVLVLSDVLGPETVRAAEHVCARSLAEYSAVLAKCGFEIVCIEPIFGVLHPPTLTREASIAWRAYARLWKSGLARIARYDWFDRSLPAVLSWIDSAFVLPHASAATPNSKWLIARKR